MFSSHLGHAQAVQFDRGVYLVCVDQLPVPGRVCTATELHPCDPVDFAVSLHEQAHESGLVLARGVQCLVAT